MEQKLSTKYNGGGGNDDEKNDGIVYSMRMHQLPILNLKSMTE